MISYLIILIIFSTNSIAIKSPVKDLSSNTASIFEDDLVNPSYKIKEQSALLQKIFKNWMMISLFQQNDQVDEELNLHQQSNKLAKSHIPPKEKDGDFFRF